MKFLQGFWRLFCQKPSPPLQPDVLTPREAREVKDARTKLLFAEDLARDYPAHPEEQETALIPILTTMIEIPTVQMPAWTGGMHSDITDVLQYPLYDPWEAPTTYDRALSMGIDVYGTEPIPQLEE